MPAATTMRTIFQVVPAWNPALAVRAMPASTTRAMPSASNPTWVSQLNRATSRLPFWPNGARFTMKVVVPASGPWSEVRPTRR